MLCPSLLSFAFLCILVCRSGDVSNRGTFICVRMCVFTCRRYMRGEGGLRAIDSEFIFRCFF